MSNRIRSSFDRRSGMDRRKAYTIGISWKRNEAKKRQRKKMHGRKKKRLDGSIARVERGG